MSLKLIQVSNALPISFPVDPTATFEPGMLAQLKIIGNDLVAGVADGTAPIGIIDEVNTHSFSQPSIDEEVIFGPDLIGTPVIGPGGQLITGHDIMTVLQNPSIVKNSFTSNYPVIVNYRNGVLKIPAGSFLNYASIVGGNIDSIRVIVSYIYQVPDIPGDNSTVGSGRITVWFTRMIAATSVFDTTQGYPLNCPLYSSLDGKLTSKQPFINAPGVAICIGPPTAIDNMLTFLWL